MIKVLHNKNFLNFALCFDEKELLEKITNMPMTDLTEVAHVDTDNLDEAFRLTNHIDSDWSTNEKVATIAKSRSTSVGDILQLNGQFWMVANIGFVKIPARKKTKSMITNVITK